MEFRVGAAEFKKVPTFTFELIFVRDRTVALKSLMLLTGKQLAPLRCRTRPCQHDFPIPRVQLTFSPKSPFGFEVRNFVGSSMQYVLYIVGWGVVSVHCRQRQDGAPALPAPQCLHNGGVSHRRSG